MMNRRLTSPRLHSHGTFLLELAREAMGTAALCLAQRPHSRARTSAPAVPWTWPDAARIGALTVVIGLGATAGLFLFLILASLIFLFGEGLGLIPLGTYDHVAGLLAPYGTATMTLLIGGACCCGLLYSVYRHSVARYRVPISALGMRRLSRRMLGNVVLLFVPLTLAGTILTRIQASATGAALVDPRLKMLSEAVPAKPLNFVLLAILFVVLAPIAGEIFFRGFLYALLRQHLPPWGAVIISASAFAALHGVPVLFPYLFFLGVAFAVVVEKTGSVYAGITLHVMVNALATASIFVTLAGW